MNQTEKQRAFDYSMYVMLSSYFDKAICSTKLQQKKLCLAYQELKDKEKEQFDEKSIQIIEKELLPNIPEWFFNQKLELLLIGMEDEECTEFRLQNKKYILRVKALYDRKKTKLAYQVWRRK